MALHWYCIGTVLLPSWHYMDTAALRRHCEGRPDRPANTEVATSSKPSAAPRVPAAPRCSRAQPQGLCSGGGQGEIRKPPPGRKGMRGPNASPEPRILMTRRARATNAKAAMHPSAITSPRNRRASDLTRCEPSEGPRSHETEAEPQARGSKQNAEDEPPGNASARGRGRCAKVASDKSEASRGNRAALQCSSGSGPDAETRSEAAESKGATLAGPGPSKTDETKGTIATPNTGNTL